MPLLKAELQAWVEKVDAEDVIAFSCSPGWKGDDRIHVAGTDFEVRESNSPLQVRELMAEAERRGQRLVLLTALDERELGDDVLARMAKRRPHPLDPWEGVRAAFQAREIDPLLMGDRIAPYLLEAHAAVGVVPLPSGVLSADIAWQLLFSSFFGVEGALTDLRAVLQWCALEGDLRLEDAPSDLRASALARLRAVCGRMGQPVIAAIEAGHGRHVLPLGLACLVLYPPKSAGVDAQALAQGRVRLERWTNMPVEREQGEVWAGAAAHVVRQDLPAVRPAIVPQVLAESDRLLDELKVNACAHYSALSPRGFESRMERLGERLEAGDVEGSAALVAVLSEHQVAQQNPERVERAQVAVRLLRWLGTPDVNDYIGSSAFVDRARRALLGGDSVGSVKRAFTGILERAAERRECENQAFAASLQEPTGADVIGVEDVLARVVIPLVEAATRVLIIVLDGLSWPVCTELCEDLEAYGYSRLAPEGGCVPAVLAALPSVTEASRTSLLSGALVAGDARVEKQNFSDHVGLRAVCRADNPPQLFHRKDLDAAWDSTLIARIESDKYKVVAAVVNAVDDHLAKDGQLSYAWKMETIRPLRPLLDAAARAGRVVILASDHGHVLETGTQLRSAEGGERWRTGTCQEGEMEFASSRVLLGGGRVILPWTEQIRYGVKKWGYHGGATPQEVLAPLVVLVLRGQTVTGWRAVPTQVPSWWTAALKVSPVAVARVAPAPVQPRKKGKPSEPTGQLDLFVAPVPFQGELIGSPILAAHLDRLRLDATDRARLSRLLGAAEGRNVEGRLRGTLPVTEIARALEMTDAEMRSFLGQAERALNVDGYPVLSMSIDGETMRIDLDVARKVFLGETGDARMVEATSSRGAVVRFRIPIVPTDMERRALELLARFGRLSERELGVKMVTRRVGGILENLMEKLVQGGFTALIEEAAGDDGRVFALRLERRGDM